MRSKSIFFSILFVSIFSLATAQETKWDIDKSHSSISFEILHFKIATIKGNFEDFSGSIKAKGEDFTDANINVTIKTASVNTNQKARDKHLRSADFFNAEVNPEITFKSSSFKKNSDGGYTIEGNLTMNGVTETVMLNGTYKGSFVHPRFKKTIGVFNFNGSVSRLKYKIGSKFPPAALGKDVKMMINVEMIKAE